MITHIKIGTTAILQGGTLSGLGKINVICGKNNSGKTTLLSAIAAGNQHSSVGTSVDEALIDEVALMHCQETVFMAGNVLNQEGLEIRAAYAELAGEEPIWYPDSTNHLASRLGELCFQK